MTSIDTTGACSGETGTTGDEADFGGVISCRCRELDEGVPGRGFCDDRRSMSEDCFLAVRSCEGEDPLTLIRVRSR